MLKNPETGLDTHGNTNLVGGLEHVDFFLHVLNIFIIPTDSIIFQRGRYTTNQ